MSGVKLKPCPFCGGVAHLGIDYENSNISIMFHDYVYYIKCQSCSALIYGSYDIKEISDKWNRRVVGQNEK